MGKIILKNKKNIGIAITILILLISTSLMYIKGGKEEIKQDYSKGIFIEETSNINNENKVLIEENYDEELEIKSKNIVVEIKGEVREPDVYVLSEDSIIKDIIELAGGITEDGDLSNINRAKKLQNHELIYIRNKNEENVQIANQNGIISDGRVNINTATIEELKTLSGIGDAKATAIINYRDKNGEFESKESIKNISGIGDILYENIKDSIVV